MKYLMNVKFDFKIILQLVVFCEGTKKRASDLHRTATTRYRCFDQDLAEFSGSWSCRTYPSAKVDIIFEMTKSWEKIREN